MQKKKKELRAIKRRYAMTITTPNRDIVQVNGQMLDVHSSYQMIPCIPSTLSYDTQKYVEDMLPYSKDTLLDICLPMNIINQQGQSVRHLTRYLLIDEKIIGIKVCTSLAWPRYQYCEYKIHYGGKTQIVMMGQFIVQFKHFKMGQNSFLSEYYRHGCEVYSVMNNVEKILRNLKQHSVVRAKLKSFALDKQIIMMYCGCQIASSSVEVYLTDSFIMQGTDKYFENGLELYSQKNYITIIADLNVVKSAKVYEEKVPNLQTESNLKHLLMQDQPRMINTLNESQKTFLNQLQDRQKNKMNYVDVQTIRKMYLWYLYNVVNCRQCFMLSLPMTGKYEIVFHLLEQISQHSGLKINELVCLYKREKNQIKYKELYPSLLIIDDIDNAIKNQEIKLYIYSDTLQESIYFRRKIKDYNNIINCGHLIPQWYNKQYSMQIQQLNEITIEGYNIRLQKYGDQILKKRSIYNSFLTILIELDKYNCTPRQKYYIIKDILPRKIKQRIKLNSINLYLINSNQRNIQENIIKAQKQFNKLQLSTITLQHNRNTSEIKYKQKLLKLKKYKQKQKDCLKCHRCHLLFEKIQGYKCIKCLKNTCLECCDKMGYIQQNILSYEIDYNCLCCLGYCSCKQCQQKDNQDNNGGSGGGQIVIKSNQMMILQDFIIQPENPLLSKYDCNRCYIEGRTNKNILIQCSNCNEQNCFNCINNSQNKIIRQKYDKWICQKCIKILNDKIQKQNILLRQKQKQKQDLRIEKEQINYQKKYQRNQNNNQSESEQSFIIKDKKMKQNILEQQRKLDNKNNNNNLVQEEIKYQIHDKKRNKKYHDRNNKKQKIQRKQGIAWWVQKNIIGNQQIRDKSPAASSTSSKSKKNYNYNHNKPLWNINDTLKQSQEQQQQEFNRRVSWKKQSNSNNTFNNPKARFGGGSNLHFNKGLKFERESTGKILNQKEHKQVEQQIDY